MIPNTDLLKSLQTADPDLFEAVKTSLESKTVAVLEEDVTVLVEESLWALSLEVSFGRSVAKGFSNLVGEVDSSHFHRYRTLIRSFGNQGPTIGRIMAEHLVPVLRHGDGLFLERFLHTAETMQNKGTYTLKDPLDELTRLLDEKDVGSANAYVDLLGDTFSENMSYVQSQTFAHHIPLAVRSFQVSKRVWQIQQLHRVLKADHHLFDHFLLGMEKGLYLLSQEALEDFVSVALAKKRRSIRLAAKFLSLESKFGLDTYEDMQVTVPISEVRHPLNRYLRARTGLTLSIRSLSDLPDSLLKESNGRTLICSDGKFIYLADEINKFPTKSENVKLYKCLTRLEAGHFEFGTFDFDLEKSLQKYQNSTGIRDQNLKCDRIFAHEDVSDLERFFLTFPIPGLAKDLFTVFEHGRIRLLLGRRYPGLVRQTLPLLHREAFHMINPKEPVDALFLLYLKIGLDLLIPSSIHVDERISTVSDKIEKEFKTAMAADDRVETCAGLVNLAYPQIDMLLKAPGYFHGLKKTYKPLRTPFNRRLRPDLFYNSHRNIDQIAAKLMVRLADRGFKVYKSDIRRKLIANKGMISLEEIQSILLNHSNESETDVPKHETSIDLSWLDLSRLLGSKALVSVLDGDDIGSVSWYKEWDCHLNDYLTSHVRVVDRSSSESSGDFYIRTLKKHQGLVQRIRYAFELLKPEGLMRLRQWVEGDEFDYRALLDFAVDKKAGKIPSDRLYIKHIKQTRDVTALLLVDLSRSTANTAYNSKATILHVEKEAIVLFCEALEVVGDVFAVAGFSSTGRLGVDYLRIKDFEENLGDTVQRRIDALAPQRNTRLGAAIRHATCQLEKVSSKVRLLIVISDGFPNDVDYKHQYAIIDTQKSIFEARSKNIFTHAITVNFAGDPKLDDLYGNTHHNVISDVGELPDKLLRIYSSLTRH
ncbi:MAG: VWA domain-containing protein [Desulfobacterales bacterium]